MAFFVAAHLVGQFVVHVWIECMIYVILHVPYAMYIIFVVTLINGPKDAPVSRSESTVKETYEGAESVNDYVSDWRAGDAAPYVIQ